MDPNKKYPQKWAKHLRTFTQDGQIQLGTPFGDALRCVAADSNHKTLLEVGTWNGRGSTLCLLEGMAEQPAGCHPRLLSLEANHSMATAAQQLYGKFVDMPLRVIHGRLGAEMLDDGAILAHPLFERVRAHHRLHGQQERVDFFQTTRIVPSGQIDVVVLDGGEFSGWGDWKAAQELRPKVVCMDDTHVMKNADALADALSKGWRVLAEGADRNGWAVLASPLQPYPYDTWK
jgi:hypothetical protein